MVDDNNQPLPENVPTQGETTTTANQPQIFSSWEHSGSCFCYLEGGRKNKARLNFNTDVNPTIEQLFEMFFFKPFILEVIIPQTNKCMKEDKHRAVTYGEFLCWLGLWFLMATVTGPDHSDFWSLGEADCFVCAPMHLGHLMSTLHITPTPSLLGSLLGSTSNVGCMEHQHDGVIHTELCQLLG